MARSLNSIMASLEANKAAHAQELELKREFKRGEIWYIEKGGYNVGSEQQAGRPAVIVSNDIANEYSSDITVVYMTTAPKKDLPTHVYINSADRVSIALCETVATISKQRVGKYWSKVTPQEMQAIDNALKIQLSLEDNETNTPPLPEVAEEYKDLQHELELTKAAVEEQIEKTAEETEKVTKLTEDLTKTSKEAAFYKSLYEQAIENMKNIALGGC